MDWINLFLMGIIGGYSAYLVSSQKAFLQHEVRANYPELLEGIITRKELFELSKKLSIPLILGLLLPLTFITKVISIYLVFLFSEIIGLYFENDFKGKIKSIAISSVFAMLLYVVLYLVYLWIPPILKLDFLTSLNEVFKPLFAAFAIIPALAIGIKRGAKKGMSAAILIIFVYILLAKVKSFKWASSFVNPMSIAFIFGAILYLVLVLSKASETPKDEVIKCEGSYEQIKKNIIHYVVMGVLLAFGSHRLLFSYDPIVQMFIGNGFGLEGGFMMLVLMLSILPSVVTSSLMGGSYSLFGLGGAMIIGYWLSPISGIVGLIIALILGGAVSAVEVIYLKKIALFAQNSLIVSDMGDNLKKATYLISDYAILVGSFVAVGILFPDISPYIGYMWILFYWLLNRMEKNKHFNQLVICPVAIIILGIALNILKMLNLLV